MGYRCVVQGCYNNRTSVHKFSEYISFFRLPNSEVMREHWFKAIGQVKMPPNSDDIRVCSVHFTRNSFRNAATASLKTATRKSRRRRLAHHAIPTLKLQPTEEESDNSQQLSVEKPQQPELRVVCREFILRPQDSASQGKSTSRDEEIINNSNRNPGTTSLIGIRSQRNSYSAQCVEAITPKSCDLENDSYYAKCTPTGEKRKRNFRSEATFPRRSDRLAQAQDHQDDTFYEKAETSCRVTSHSAEEPPPWKRRKRVINDDLNATRPNNRMMPEEEEDPEHRIQWLKKNIHCLQSRLQFYQSTNSEQQEEIEQLRAKCAAYALELKEEQDAKNKMFVEIEELKKLNVELYKKLQSSGIDNTMCKEEQKSIIHTILQPYFTEGQIRCILDGRKWVKWSVDDFAAAISLRSVSPKAYKYLRNKLNFPFPSLSSLRRWALAKFDMSEGFLTDVLTVMREKSKALSPMERIAVITFDEMALTPEVCFDAKLEQMVDSCTKVQVIMVRGLFSNWKQPIYYKFNQPMNKSILNEALSLLDQAGYEVVACTCDMVNKGVWGELGITTNNHYFPHPTIDNAFVYAFADVPHLLKLLRNWYVDNGLQLQGCSERFTVNILQTIVDKGAKSDSCVAHKLTQRVLDARNSMSQAVWPAARIWSRSVAKAVEWGGKRKLFTTTEYNKFANLILIVNDWFDVHNSQTKYGQHKGVNGYGVDIDNQKRILLLMSSYMESMRVWSRKKLMPFQEGILISNASLQGLHEYLGQKFPNDYEYLITRRLQQDVLQNFFSYIRGMGATRDQHPSGYEFRYRLRWYILGKHSQTVFTNNENSEEDLNASCISSSLGNSTALQDSNSSDIIILHADGSGRDNLQRKYDCNNVLQNCSNSQISNISTIDHSSEPEYLYEPDDVGEIVLTAELFMNIVNISPDLTIENTEDECQSKDNCDDDLFDSPHELDEIAHLHKLGNISEESTSSLDGISSGNCIEEAGLVYVAGYVAHRFRLKYRHLGEPIQNFGGNTSHGKSEQTQIISKWHLMQPSQELLHAARIMEKCFVQFHGPKFSTDIKVIQKLVLIIKSQKEYNDCVPDEVLQCLVRTRTYIRIREINKKFVYGERRP